MESYHTLSKDVKSRSCKTSEGLPTHLGRDGCRRRARANSNDTTRPGGEVDDPSAASPGGLLRPAGPQV